MDTFVDEKGHALQPGLAGQVGGRLTRADACLDQRLDVRAFGFGHRPIRQLVERVERQTEPPQRQPGGLVEGVQAALTEGDSGRFEALRLLANQRQQFNRHAGPA
jgi:hypothetical protein